MTKNPLVSIIIVNYNGQHHLKKCFESLSKIDYNQIEIILVDNNSTDNSIEFIKSNYSSTIIIKLDKNYGFAEPNNIGVKNAKGSYLLFLNNDTIVTENFISSLVQYAESNERIGICQSLLIKQNGDIDSSGDYIDKIGVSFSSKEKVTEVKEIFSAKAASMLMRRSVFEEIGGFDEKFFTSFEDVDLGWRTWLIGYEVVVIPESVVYHLGSQTTKNMKKETVFHGTKNQISMKITNFEYSRTIWSLFVFFLKYGLKSILISFHFKTKGNTTISSTNYEEKLAEKPDFKMIMKGIFWVIKNFNYLIKKRNQINSKRVRSTKDLEKRNLILNSF